MSELYDKVKEYYNSYSKYYSFGDDYFKDKFNQFIFEIACYGLKNRTRKDGDLFIQHTLFLGRDYSHYIDMGNVDYTKDYFKKLESYGIPFYFVTSVILLHDVVAEKSNINLFDVRFLCNENGFEKEFEYIATPLSLLTRVDGIEYEEYINRISDNLLASLVKFLAVNYELKLLVKKKFDDNDYLESQKYLKAFYVLNSKYHFLEKANALKESINNEKMNDLYKKN